MDRWAEGMAYGGRAAWADGWAGVVVYNGRPSHNRVERDCRLQTNNWSCKLFWKKIRMLIRLKLCKLMPDAKKVAAM